MACALFPVETFCAFSAARSMATSKKKSPATSRTVPKGDLQSLLFDHAPVSTKEKRRRSARVSRLLRMIRTHHLIQKVPHTHRYVLTPRGRDIISAILASQQITLHQ